MVESLGKKIEGHYMGKIVGKLGKNYNMKMHSDEDDNFSYVSTFKN